MQFTSRVTNTLIAVIAAALLSFVLGFAFGKFLGANRTFELEKWKSLTGTIVAIIGAAVAFLGVRTTLRVRTTRFLIDGEVVVCGEDGVADFARLQSQA